MARRGNANARDIALALLLSVHLPLGALSPVFNSDALSESKHTPPWSGQAASSVIANASQTLPQVADGRRFDRTKGAKDSVRKAGWEVSPAAPTDNALFFGARRSLGDTSAFEPQVTRLEQQLNRSFARAPPRS